jgi:hypothetical protein
MADTALPLGRLSAALGCAVMPNGASRCGANLPVPCHLPRNPPDNSSLDAALCFSRSDERAKGDKDRSADKNLLHRGASSD